MHLRVWERLLVQGKSSITEIWILFFFISGFLTQSLNSCLISIWPSLPSQKSHLHLLWCLPDIHPPCILPLPPQPAAGSKTKERKSPLGAIFSVSGSLSNWLLVAKWWVAAVVRRSVWCKDPTELPGQSSPSPSPAAGKQKNHRVEPHRTFGDQRSEKRKNLWRCSSFLYWIR